MKHPETKPKHRSLREWYSAVPRNTKRLLFVAATIVPLLVWLSIYFLYPIGSVVGFSFTNAHLAYDNFTFVGIEQYKRLFSDATFWIALKNTLMCVVIIMPVSLILSTLTAVGLNALTNKWRQFYTFAYFMPSLLSMTAVCLVWRWLYHPAYGFFNAVLNVFGIGSQQFLMSSSQALYCVCAIQIWCIFGYYAVILLTAIRGVDQSIYESAKIDGVNAFQKFFRITLPMIRNALLFVTVMTTNAAFMFFTPTKILTKGGPGTSTTVMLLYILRNGIEQSNIGYASAASLVLMLMILSVSGIQFLITRERKPRPLKVYKTTNSTIAGGK